MTDNQHVSIAKHTDILELLTQELESRGVVFEKKNLQTALFSNEYKIF